ncbi:MAG: FKBP-type peptidyl-prolyl cis-trans isomerase [Planctomycetota bacterium]
MGRGRGNRGQAPRKRGSAGQNRAASEDHLARNAQRDEVVVTPSGLQIETLAEGDGAQPHAQSIVTTHQRAWLVNGTVIQDTFKDHRPERFALSECVPGFREGLLGMRVGGRARLTVPSDLAWGRKGAGSKIGPHQVIIFDVRLLAVADA